MSPGAFQFAFDGLQQALGLVVVTSLGLLLLACGWALLVGGLRAVVALGVADARVR